MKNADGQSAGTSPAVNQLLPCPCCKSAAVEFNTTLSEIPASIGVWDYVICNAAQGGCGMRSGLFESEGEASKAWNLRPTDQRDFKIAELTGALQDAAGDFNRQDRELSALKKWASAAFDCINRGVEFLPWERIGEWEGVRAIIEAYPVEPKKEDE